MWIQKEIVLRARERGIHLVTNEILQELPPLPDVGLLNLFIKHTSAALSINEDADPDVRVDMEYILDKLVPDIDPNYIHTDEGPDDASSHSKASIIGPSLTIPITKGRLNLGTWQGIYLLEFREYKSSRHIIATITGE
ncbi:MAG: YjbQ family protein [Muribaculaceae bacterium]|nr:YjbQ family protein [Muribaculaceae bacterium]